MSIAEKIKVLIVDDQVTSRLLLSDALTQLGATVQPVDFADPAALAQACAGANCVVSTLAGLREALAAGDPGIKGARRANLLAASDYLDVAPRVVLVAQDAPVPDIPITVPRELADPETLQQLVETYDLGNPVGRLIKALDLRPA